MSFSAHPTTLKRVIFVAPCPGTPCGRAYSDWSTLTRPRRFSTENFPNILKIVDGVQAIAKKYNATAGQVALAWLLAQGDDIIPIPGTRKVKVRRPPLILMLVCQNLILSYSCSTLKRTSVR